jgi:hypothetical protein
VNRNFLLKERSGKPVLLGRDGGKKGGRSGSGKRIQEKGSLAHPLFCRDQEISCRFSFSLRMDVQSALPRSFLVILHQKCWALLRQDFLYDFSVDRGEADMQLVAEIKPGK